MRVVDASILERNPYLAEQRMEPGEAGNIIKIM